MGCEAKRAVSAAVARVSMLKPGPGRAENLRMRNGRLTALILMGTLALAAGVTSVACSRSTLLPDAYYAEHMVPIYPHAKLTDQMGGNETGDGPGESWDSMAWWFESKDDPDRIVAFYQAHLTGWQKDTEGDGTVTFKTIPPDGDTGEEVYVRIGIDSKIQIGESVKSGKKAAARKQS